MRKRRVILYLSLITLLITGLIIYSKKIEKKEIVKNVLGQLEQEYNYDSKSNITSIDVTGIILGNETEHDHTFKTMYNDKEHWDECTICGEKENIIEHNYIDSGWTLGNSCSHDNFHVFICNCGYSYKNQNGKKECVYSNINNINSYYYVTRCNSCSHDYNFHECRKSDGTRINCLNLGTCSICKYNYTKSVSSHAGSIIERDDTTDSCKIYCRMCNLYLGTMNYKKTQKISDKTFESVIDITINDNATYSSNYCYCAYRNNVSVSQTISNIGKTYTLKTTEAFKQHTEKIIGVESNLLGNINGLKFIISAYSNISADTTSPVISEISKEDLTTWSKTKPITITGTENYCNTVYVEIVDDEEKIFFTGNATVNSGKYSISCTPKIEVGINGRKFKVIVTDPCNNKTEQEFEIARVDNIAPTITSENEVNDGWAKSKKITFSAIDYGIGKVQIGFNNVSDYKLANQDGESYSREYELYGDVYAEREANVYYKDGLGNISTKKIIINKLDNTDPTITNVELHNNKITVTSNDEHETEGERSGVVKYRYLSSTEEIENPKLTIENSIEIDKDNEIKIDEIYKIKYIYIVAEDLVGNTSKVYKLEVPQLILESKVNLNANNGKGAIELEWPSYDIIDKYFKIYRKKENETNWETIVSLEEKFNGNTYTDLFASDIAKPNEPNIIITENIESNNINITSTANDNGSIYSYYIEAYDANDINLLLNTSNK